MSIPSPGNRRSSRLSGLESYRFPARRASVPAKSSTERVKKVGSRPAPLQNVGQNDADASALASARLVARTPATAPPSYRNRSNKQTAVEHNPARTSTSLSDVSESDAGSSVSESDDEHDEDPARSVGPRLPASGATSSVLPSPRGINKKRLAGKGPKAPRKRERRPNRPNGQPPRPMNSWLQFRSKRISAMRQEYGQMAQFGAQSELSKRIAEEWHCLSSREKGVFERMAEDARQEHYRRYPEYRFQPRRGVKAKKEAAAAAKKSVVAKKHAQEEPSASSKAAPRATSKSKAASPKRTTARMQSSSTTAKARPESKSSTRSPRRGAFPEMPRQASPVISPPAPAAQAPHFFRSKCPSSPPMPEPQFARPEPEYAAMSVDEYAREVSLVDSDGTLYPSLESQPRAMEYLASGLAVDQSQGYPTGAYVPAGYVEDGPLYNGGLMESVRDFNATLLKAVLTPFLPPAPQQAYNGPAPLEFASDYKFPAQGTTDVAMSDSTPAMTAPDTPRSSVGPLDKASQRATEANESRSQLAVPGPSSAFRPRRLDLPLTPNARRASIIHVLPAGPPGSVPEIAEHLDVMEPAETWRERRQSHSLFARWQGGSQLGIVAEASPPDHDGGAAEAWQQFLNVPADDLSPQLPPPVDAHTQGDAALLASLGIDLPASNFQNAGIFDDQASAFAEGRSWVEAQSAMPWTRDEVVRGREAWFARSGHIPTVPLLVQPHWNPSDQIGNAPEGRH